jgi:hypothetical protein
VLQVADVADNLVAQPLDILHCVCAAAGEQLRRRGAGVWFKCFEGRLLPHGILAWQVDSGQPTRGGRTRRRQRVHDQGEGCSSKQTQSMFLDHAESCRFVSPRACCSPP